MCTSNDITDIHQQVNQAVFTSAKPGKRLSGRPHSVMVIFRLLFTRSLLLQSCFETTSTRTTPSLLDGNPPPPVLELEIHTT